MDLLTRLVDLCRRFSVPGDAGLRLVALRGCRVTSGDVVMVTEHVDDFDDVLFAIDPAEGRIHHAPCTAGQPGWHWIRKYGRGNGVPFVRYGSYLYRRGPHPSKPPNHPAFRQHPSELGRVAVIRDVDQDGVPEYARSEDFFDYPLDTGINIHAYRRSQHVGPGSSGCTTVQDGWDGERWQGFYRLAYQTYRDQEMFWYTIFPADWLVNRPNVQGVMYGSQGRVVTQLQQFLLKRGLSCPVDGVFGRVTDIAYRQWQQKQHAVPDGLCLNPTWV